MWDEKGADRGKLENILCMCLRVEDEDEKKNS